MTDDDPIEEARVAAMTGGAAAARVVEVAVQAAQRRREDEAHLTRRLIHHNVDDAVQQAGEAFDPLSEPDRWRDAAGPATGPQRYTLNKLGVDHDRSVTKAEASKLITAASEYDNPARRRLSNDYLEHAGVAAEPREARKVSDLNNAADPAKAAATAKSAPPVARRLPPRTSGRVRQVKNR